MCVCIATLYNSVITRATFIQLNGFIGDCWLAGSGINGGGRKSVIHTIEYINSVTIATYLPLQTLVVEGRTVY